MGTVWFVLYFFTPSSRHHLSVPSFTNNYFLHWSTYSSVVWGIWIFLIVCFILIGNIKLLYHLIIPWAAKTVRVIGSPVKQEVAERNHGDLKQGVQDSSSTEKKHRVQGHQPYIILKRAETHPEQKLKYPRPWITPSNIFLPGWHIFGYEVARDLTSFLDHVCFPTLPTTVHSSQTEPSHDLGKGMSKFCVIGPGWTTLYLAMSPLKHLLALPKAELWTPKSTWLPYQYQKCSYVQTPSVAMAKAGLRRCMQLHGSICLFGHTATGSFLPNRNST